MSGLNWNKQFALEQAADDADLLQELLDIFKDTCIKDVAQIKAGIESQDIKAVSSAAHSIKGAAASLGILGIRDLALAMETDARNGSLTVAEEQLQRLEELVQELQEL